MIPRSTTDNRRMRAGGLLRWLQARWRYIMNWGSLALERAADDIG